MDQWTYVAFLFLTINIITMFFYLRNKKNQNKLLLEKEREIEHLKKQFHEFNKDLEIRVEERTKQIEEDSVRSKKLEFELKKALKNAEDANYLKNAFLSNMSHEIRTPLNGIIGFASLLETELSVLENTELFDYANGISQSGERLLHLLNNIIDISRIEANDLEVSLKQCNIIPIINEVSQLFIFKANDKGLKFNVNTIEINNVYVDANSFSKILTNIIDNAIKYTETGYINISNGFNEETGEIFIRVKDTGIGIDSAYLPNIFDAFRQESLGYSRAYQGAGLGLPLAKRLIELMRGRIDIDSIKGIGTTVTIYLKAVINTNSFTHYPSGIEEIKTPIILKSDLKIFIVEDDRMNRLVLQKMLENNFNNIVMAVDGDDSLNILNDYYSKGEIFDIMLFDINLPAPWDGIKLMKEIKNKWKEYNVVPFVAQTAYAMSGDRERLLESGFDDYIAKPIQQGRLIRIIKNQIYLKENLYRK